MLTIDAATYVKAAALKTDRHCGRFSFGTYFSRIGNALLKLASNSTGRVTRWINVLVAKQPRAKKAAINVRAGLLVMANTDGSPITKTADPIF